MIGVLSSTSGRQACEFELARVRSDDALLVIEVRIKQSFWERGQPLAQAAPVDDVSVVLHQVLATKSDFSALRSNLERWLSARDEFSQGFVKRDGNPWLGIAVVSDSSLVCSRETPAFVLEYFAEPAMRAKWMFLVDETCLRGFANDLAKSLEIGL